jgi:hypothetical protein
MSRISALERYISRYDRLPIPYSGDRYTVAVDGYVYDTETNQSIVGDIDGLMTLRLFDRDVRVSISWVLAATFKPMYKGEEFVLDWKVMCAGIAHASKLIWQPPLGGQPCPENPEFNIIPGFSRFGASNDGRIFCREKCREIPSRQSSNGYRNVSVITDSKYVMTTGVHRLMGLAWLPYGINVANMTINHLDGNKQNNRLDNFAWATYLENNIHAKDTGLNMSRIPIVVKDYWEDKILKFDSYSHGGKVLNINSGALNVFAKERKDDVLYFRYMVREDDGFVVFPNKDVGLLKEQHRAHVESKATLRCVARNVYNGCIVVANSPGELMRALGIAPGFKDYVGTALRSKVNVPIFDHVFSYRNDIKPVINWTAEELAMFKGNVSISGATKIVSERKTTPGFRPQPMMMKDNYTNKVTEHNSIQDIADILKCSAQDIKDYLYKKAKYPFQYRYSIRAKMVKNDWPIYDIEELEVWRKEAEDKVKRLKCMAVHYKTLEITHADGGSELAAKVGLTPDEVDTGLNSKLIYPHRNYWFSYVMNPKRTFILEDDEIVAYKDRTFISNPIRVTHPDGSTKVFINSKECAEEYGLDSRALNNALLRKDIYCISNNAFEKISR